MYNPTSGNKTATSFGAIKRQQLDQSRAKTSKGKIFIFQYFSVGEQRSLSMEMQQEKGSRLKNTGNQGGNAFMNNRGSMTGNKTKTEQQTAENPSQVKLP